tara:strand:- start:6 stop:449 length:444 start_codon:yes stop_codon:yes gene_type:complete
VQAYQNLINKAKRLTKSKVKKDLFNFIRQLEGGLAVINTDTIFKKSEDTQGDPIGFYSRATEEITEGRKKEGDPFDLRETGTFLDSLYVKVQNDSILFDTTDPKKSEVLKNLLSEDIFGLQDSELDELIEQKLAPFMVIYYAQELLK